MLDWNLENNQQGDKNKGKVNYAKLQEGYTHIRLLLGDGEAPHMRWTHWLPQLKRKLTCAGYDCPIDKLIKKAKAEGEKSPYNSSKTFAMNIWNYDTNQMELMEEGITMIEALKEELAEIMQENNIKNPRDVVIKVRKKKNSSDKWMYKFTLHEISPMEEHVQKAFDERIDLMEYFVVPTVEQVEEILQLAPGDTEGYNKILGFVKKETNEGIGVEVE